MKIKIHAYHFDTQKMVIVNLRFTTFLDGFKTDDFVLNNWSISLV